MFKFLLQIDINCEIFKNIGINKIFVSLSVIKFKITFDFHISRSTQI